MPDFDFQVQIEDAEGARCQQILTLTENTVCGPLTDWVGAPGLCKLRIKNYVDGFIPVAGPCVGGGTVTWDGTFADWVGAGLDATFFINAAFDRINGKVLLAGGSLHYNHLLNRWRISIGSMCPAPAEVWGGNLVSTNPVGIYITDDDPFGVGNIEIEAYT